MELLKETIRPNDDGLVERCRDGDPQAFEELVGKYKDRVYTVVYRFLGNHEDAQDVAQEVFVRAYQGIRGFKGASQVYTWLYSIAGNLSRNRLRDAKRKGRNRNTSLDAMEQAAQTSGRGQLKSDRTPDLAARSQEMQDALQSVLDELPEHYRMVFVLRTFDQLSYDEIAESLGCPKGTVKSRLNQARVLLQRRLKELQVI